MIFPPSLRGRIWSTPKQRMSSNRLKHPWHIGPADSRRVIFIAAVLSCFASRLLNRHGLPSARRHRPPPKHRVRRERMPQEGMLLQIDGSHHAWLEERGPRFVLLLAVDDATGTVAGAVFPARGGHPRLLPADGRGHPPLWAPPGPLWRSARGLQVRPESPATFSHRWKPPTSAAPCRNWALSRSSPVRHRLRAG